MVFPDLTLTQFLAAAIGLYMVAGCFGILIDRRLMRQIMWDLQSNAGLTFIAGIFTFTIGAAIFGLHRAMGTWLEIAVTVIGIAAIVEGVLLLAFPRAFLTLFAKTGVIERFGFVFALFGIGLGGALLWGAFTT